MSTKYKRGVVFGVFDCLHDGHKDFLRQASDLAERVTVIIARASAVQELKNKKPFEDEQTRLANVRALKSVSCTVLGDTEQGSYEVLKSLNTDVILLGYDQDWLDRDLTEKMSAGTLPKIPLVRLNAYHPDRFHTSLIRVV